MKSLPAWSRSLILLDSPLSPLVARGCGVGVIGRACSGESRPLVWGHKTVSLCVSAVLQGQKDMPCSDTHTTHTHTYIEGPLHSSTSARQSVQLPGKGNYLLLCLSSGFQSAQLPALRGNRDSGKFVGFIFTGFYSNITRLSNKHDSTRSNIKF